MIERDYSDVLAVEIREELQVPIEEKFVEHYSLRPGMRTPFTRYQIVERKTDGEIKGCANCGFDTLIMKKNDACPICV